MPTAPFPTQLMLLDRRTSHRHSAQIGETTMKSGERQSDFDRALNWKQTGGTSLVAGVSTGIWMGGMQEVVDHKPFVYVGPEEWDHESELRFFRDFEQLEAFIAELRAAAKNAWGDDV